MKYSYYTGMAYDDDNRSQAAIDFMEIYNCTYEQVIHFPDLWEEYTNQMIRQEYIPEVKEESICLYDIQDGNRGSAWADYFFSEKTTYFGGSYWWGVVPPMKTNHIPSTQEVKDWALFYENLIHEEQNKST